MIPVKPVIEADLLIVGGGIGGLMAGIAAGKAGCKNVVIMEKCHARRSGSGATGNDHFNCYIPSYHGDDIDPYSRKPCRASWASSRNRASCTNFWKRALSWCRCGMLGA